MHVYLTYIEACKCYLATSYIHDDGQCCQFLSKVSYDKAMYGSLVMAYIGHRLNDYIFKKIEIKQSNGFFMLFILH